jgi:hypothetical protein
MKTATQKAASRPGQSLGDGVLVDPGWLAEHIDGPDVRVVEVDVSPAAYDCWHIDGAALRNRTRRRGPGRTAAHPPGSFAGKRLPLPHAGPRRSRQPRRSPRRLQPAQRLPARPARRLTQPSHTPALPAAPRRNLNDAQEPTVVRRALSVRTWPSRSGRDHDLAGVPVADVADGLAGGVGGGADRDDLV